MQQSMVEDLAEQSIPRPRLFAAIDETTRCCLLRAPTGFGKSVAMAQYCLDKRHQHDAVAWVSLKDCGFDLQLCAERIQEQIAASCDGADQRSLPAAGRKRLDGLVGLAEWLWQIDAKTGFRLLICLDDVKCDSRSISRLEEFMLAAPRTTRFVAASSVDVGFSRLKSRRELKEIRAEALAFTFEEAESFAGSVDRGKNFKDLTRNIWSQSEGWPAIFCLMIQSTADHESDFRALESASSNYQNEDVHKYLRSFIFDFDDDEVFEFCIKASVLGKISSDYFNYVYQTDNATYFIDKLYVERMLLRPTIGSQDAYTFHPLLRNVLEQTYFVRHGSLSHAMVRAAEWQRRNSNSRESIRLSLRAGDDDLAAAVASENMMDIAVRQGAIDQIQSWQGSFSDTVVAESPTIALGLAWAQMFSHDNKTAATLLASVRPMKNDEPDERKRLEVEAWREMISAIGEATNDNLVGSRRLCNEWLNNHKNGHLICKGAILTCLCFIAGSEHKFIEQRKLCTEASSVNILSNHSYALGWLHSAMIFAELFKGNIHTAAYLHGIARADERARIDEAPFTANLLKTLGLEIRYEANDLAGIDADVATVLDFSRQHGVVDVIFSAYRTAAAVAGREGDYQAAMELLEELHALASHLGFPRLDALARIAKADLLIASGQGGAAAALPKRDDPVFRSPHGPELLARLSLTEARIAARERKYHLASRSANLALRHAQRTGLGRLEVSALLCGAVALAGTERATAAAQRASDAVDLAFRLGCYRTLFDDRLSLRAFGRVSAPIIAMIPSDGKLEAHYTSPSSIRDQQLEAGASLALTRKELIVLSRVKEGCSNKEIGLKHDISEDTVKWHLKNVFAKIGVQNRVQAVLRANELGI